MKLLLSCIALLSIASLSHAQGYCVNGQCYGYTPAPSYQTQYYGAWGGYGNGAPSYYGGYGYGASYYNGGCVGGQCFR